MNTIELAAPLKLRETSVAQKVLRLLTMILLACGASAEAADPYVELIKAAQAGDLGALKAAPRDDAVIDAATTHGDTALLYASARGHREGVEHLLAAATNANTFGTDGRSPLDWAADRGHAEIAVDLIESGADIESCENGGQAPLVTASARGRVAIVSLLRANGADIHARDKHASSGAESADADRPTSQSQSVNSFTSTSQVLTGIAIDAEELIHGTGPARIVRGSPQSASTLAAGATAKLSKLSETMVAADIAEIRQLLRDGADANVKIKNTVQPAFYAPHRMETLTSLSCCSPRAPTPTWSMTFTTFHPWLWRPEMATPPLSPD